MRELIEVRERFWSKRKEFRAVWNWNSPTLQVPLCLALTHWPTVLRHSDIISGWLTAIPRVKRLRSSLSPMGGLRKAPTGDNGGNCIAGFGAVIAA